MKTSPQQISIFTEDESTSSQAGFRANLTPQQVKGLVKKMTDTSGQKCLEQFEKLNPGMLWEKTFMALLIGMEDWFSTKCKLTWKMKGTKFNRVYFQLVPSTLPIEEIEFGLLPTVKTFDAKQQRALTNGKNISQVTGKEYGVHLVQLAKSNLLPTPQTQGLKVCDQNGKTQFMDLRLLPTPNASDNRNRGNPSDPCIQKRIKNGKQVGLTMMVDGQLNPQYVGEMMGVPENWTELPFQTGEKNQLKPT